MDFRKFLVLIMFVAGGVSRAEPPDRSATEGHFCFECDQARNADMDKLKDRITELEKALREKGPAPQANDVAAVEHQKERLLKKIDNMDCPKMGGAPGGGGDNSLFGDDNEAEPGDMFAQIKSQMGGGGSGGRPGPGGPDSGSGDRRSSQLTLAMREEIEDAMEEKMNKCKKKAQRQSQRSSMASQGGGSNGMMNMNTQTPMMSMMGGMMGGGMNSMFANPYMTTSYPSMNSMMSGGFNNMNSWMSPYMSNTNSNSYYMPLYMQLMQGYSPYTNSNTNIRTSGLGI